MKYKSKADFIADSTSSWTQLWETIDRIPVGQREKRMGSPRRSVTDVLAHLYDWHRLAIGWYRDGEKGRTPPLPAPGFNWRQLKELNAQFFKSHQHDAFPSISRRLKLSHNRLMKIVNELSSEQLLQPGQYAWTKKLPIASYLGPNMASHYRWATKKLKTMQSNR